MGRHDEIEAAARALVDALSDTRYHGIDIGTLGDPMRALRAALALPREGAEPSAEAVREVCAKACLIAADECPGTEDEVATWREASMWCAAAIRALPLPAPADAGNVERAKCGWCGGQGYVEGSVNLRPYRLPCFRCDPNEKRALAEMKAALLLAMKDGAAAERAAKGGERG